MPALASRPARALARAKAPMLMRLASQKTLAPRLSRDSAAEPPAQSGALLRLGRVRGPSS